MIDEDSALMRGLERDDEPDHDLPAARLTLRTAISAMPEDCERARELARESLQLLEDERLEGQP